MELLYLVNLRPRLVEVHGVLAQAVQVLLHLVQGLVLGVLDFGGNHLEVNRVFDYLVVFRITLL